MSRLIRALALALVAAAAIVPGAALGRDDDDIVPGDAPSSATIFAADGTSTTEAAHYGTRAFVDRLRRAGASGSYVTSYDDGQNSGFSRSGFARPSTARYLRFKRVTRAEARRILTVRHSVEPDGDRVYEQSFAVDVATGTVRRASLETAKALSLDPRGGRPGTQYVYQVHVQR